MSVFSELFKSRDKPQNRTTGSNTDIGAENGTFKCNGDR